MVKIVNKNLILSYIRGPNGALDFFVLLNFCTKVTCEACQTNISTGKNLAQTAQWNICLAYTTHRTTYRVHPFVAAKSDK